jgi:hypothetical protein
LHGWQSFSVSTKFGLAFGSPACIPFVARSLLRESSVCSEGGEVVWNETDLSNALGGAEDSFAANGISVMSWYPSVAAATLVWCHSMRGKGVTLDDLFLIGKLFSCKQTISLEGSMGGSSVAALGWATFRNSPEDDEAAWEWALSVN